MSCQLLPFSHLNDIIGLRDYLFPELKDLAAPSVGPSNTPSAEDGQGTDGWDEDWEDWNKEDEAVDQVQNEVVGPTDVETEATSDVTQKWFQECLVSVSPAADLMALANKQRLVIMAHDVKRTSYDTNVKYDAGNSRQMLCVFSSPGRSPRRAIAMTPVSAKYDTDRQYEAEEILYSTVWSGTISSDDGEFVTAILCVPLASQKRSTQGAPDWTCILVGFSTGYVRMYTETGTLLLSQKLHTEPVQKLKCNTYTPPRYLGVAEQHEEIVILYMRALVTIDGFSLFQALKACRNQVARATASGETSIQSPPLAYKKWAPQEMESIVDCHTTGVHMPNPFDQMVLASMSSQHATIRPTPPAASVYLMAGIGPYLGFFYAVEGSTQPILSDVAYAVASKLKSAIMSAASGWLSFGSRNKEDSSSDKQPKIEPATPLPLRFGVPDQRREGLFVCLSPNNAYAASADSFGRVMLIDMERGMVVRMWKGYRDAMVGWVEVREDDSHSSRSKQSRIAQFLIIYAARRGILEVWMAGNGPRVAAFNVSKYCQLIYISHGILGLNNVTSKGIKIKAFQVALMDPDGTVKTVEVPFHLALSDKNNKRVRDLHLLKKIKQVLKENNEESDALDTNIKDLLLNIKLSNIAQQAVERILSTEYLTPKFMEGILQVCIHRLQVLGEENLDIERRLFLQFCNLQLRLIQTYTDIDQLHGNSDPVETDTQTLSKLLGLSESEVDHVLCHVDRCQQVFPMNNKVTARVRFDADSVSHISGFLNCFTCTPRADLDTSEHGTSQQGFSAITLVKDLTNEKKLQLGMFLFDRCLRHGCSASDLGAMLRKSGIPTEEVGKLLVWTWLQHCDRPIDSVSGLFSILKIIVSNIDRSKIVVDNNMESPWWQTIRHLCSHTHHSLSAYLVAIVSRSVTIESLKIPSRIWELESGTSSLPAKDPDADTVSFISDTSPTQETGRVPLESEVWNVLIKQLEDLTCLDCLLKLSPSDSGRRMSSPEDIIVSVSGLLEGGKGCITEVVARQVARVAFQPEDLYQTAQQEDSLTYGSLQINTIGTCDKQLPTTNDEVIWDHMQLLRSRFPHSVENDVLFSNSCWEYTVLWNKQPEDTMNLKSGLDFLRLVQNAMLRQGVASMMWHMFISKKFQATAQLMEKVGKVPKDRLCRKDIGIGENRLPLFIKCVCDFFNVIMEANCETNEVPVFNIEPLWNKVKGTVSLVELAIDQKATNYGLLKLHHQLAVLIDAILTFNLKSVKVLSLFDSKGKHAFFQELHCHPLLPNHNIDTTISLQRKQLLTRVISQAVMKMRESYCPPPSEAASPGTSVGRCKLTEAGRWPETIIEIGEQFGLDLDYLKRHHVCELYSAGFDKLAEEVLLTVNDHEYLGTQLLTIVGQRVAYRLSKLESHSAVELMSNVNPALSMWLKSMNAKLLVHPDVSNSDLQTLVTQTLSQLQEGNSEHELALSLVELVQVL